MRQTLVPGQPVEFLTPDEAATLFERIFRETVHERVRAGANIKLDAAGAGQDEVYTVPLGFEFEARRVFLDWSGSLDPNVGAIQLNGIGVAVDYLRSGTRIEWAFPINTAGTAAAIPGTQTWGEEQGPYLRNGETFEVRGKGLPPGNTLAVLVEGILRRPPPTRDHGAGVKRGR